VPAERFRIDVGAAHDQTDTLTVEPVAQWVHQGGKCCGANIDPEAFGRHIALS
jgi:hypothetical protein